MLPVYRWVQLMPLCFVFCFWLPGGGANFLCLPDEGPLQTPFPFDEGNDNRGRLYGVEYMLGYYTQTVGTITTRYERDSLNGKKEPSDHPSPSRYMHVLAVCLP